MPPKSQGTEVELKVRIPKDLFQRVNDFRHERKCDSRKEAVVMLLEAGLGLEPKPGIDADNR